jgi:hypothetical protein
VHWCSKRGVFRAPKSVCSTSLGKLNDVIMFVIRTYRTLFLNALRFILKRGAKELLGMRVSNLYLMFEAPSV